MDGCMDGWMSNGWTGGWTDEGMAREMDGQICQCLDRWTDARPMEYSSPLLQYSISFQLFSCLGRQIYPAPPLRPQSHLQTWTAPFLLLQPPPVPLSSHLLCLCQACQVCSCLRGGILILLSPTLSHRFSPILDHCDLNPNNAPFEKPHLGHDSYTLCRHILIWVFLAFTI